VANTHWYSNQDFHQNQLLNLLLQVLAGTTPSGPVEGQLWYDSTGGSKGPRFHDGTSTIDLLARGSQRGTQTAATVSDFTTAVQALQWRTMVAPSSSVPMNSQQFSSLATATTSGQAVEYAQFQTALAAVQSGLDWKEHADIAALVNVTISAPGATINGRTMVAGDRVLLTTQTTTSQTGLWTWNGAAVPLTRPADSPTGNTGSILRGSIVAAYNGTTEQFYMQSATGTGTNGAITVDTDTQTWSNPFTPTTYTAGNGVTIASTVISAVAGAGVIVDGSGVRLALAADTGGLRASRVYATTLATSSTSYTVNHGLALPDKWKFALNVMDTVNGGQVFPSVAPSDVNNVVLGFSAAPSSSQMSVTVVG
jgi:hypothetical protein